MTSWLEISKEVGFWYLVIAALFFFAGMVWDLHDRVRRPYDPKRFPWGITAGMTALACLGWFLFLCGWVWVWSESFYQWVMKKRW